MTDQELKAKRAKAEMREKIKGLFSQVPEARADAEEALKAAWSYTEPSFRMDEIAQHGLEAASLSAMRRDSAKEFIDWLLKI